MNSAVPKTLIMFDIDGTLLDAGAIDDRCYIETAKAQFSVDEINSDWRSYPQVTNSGITAALHQQVFSCPASTLFIEQFRSAFTHRIRATLASHPHSCQAIPGAIAFLNHLRQRRDIALAIATGGWDSCAKAKLHHAQLPTDGLPFASASDAQGREAIMAIAHNRALNHYQVPGFQQRIYIGDGIWDVKASTIAGYQFIGIATGGQASAISQAGARHIFPDFNQSDAMLQTITQLSR